MSNRYDAPAGAPLDPAIVRAFQGLAVANISDCMDRIVGTAHLRPVHNGKPVAGRALTVRTRPGDNLLVHKAIDLAQPGDVIVVDAGGDVRNAIIGEIMASLAASRGVAGFVIDGCIRDADTLAGMDIAVYARGVTHRGPYKDGPGQIGVPVSVDGMPVQPGDLIVGDRDGLLAIAPAQALELSERVRKLEAAEKETLAAIAAGKLDRSWVDRTLQAKGYL